jgi:hypothetical protein
MIFSILSSDKTAVMGGLIEPPIFLFIIAKNPHLT